MPCRAGANDGLADRLETEIAVDGLGVVGGFNFLGGGGTARADVDGEVVEVVHDGLDGVQVFFSRITYLAALTDLGATGKLPVGGS